MATLTMKELQASVGQVSKAVLLHRTSDCLSICSHVLMYLTQVHFRILWIGIVQNGFCRTCLIKMVFNTGVNPIISVMGVVNQCFSQCSSSTCVAAWQL